MKFDIDKFKKDIENYNPVRWWEEIEDLNGVVEIIKYAPYYPAMDAIKKQFPSVSDRDIYRFYQFCNKDTVVGRE